ncbi:shikimate O-hydroxycinnamoyltransferase [Aspergillus udagawae]|uniref:Shikimate O-hydroxycinnamoyltransferase n=1 Tax=Aspergillus udagawae TaxID=91492 RepID=A0ABQ1AAM9_9EURO|nr:shikimate O-hydroxycinnamoyltransferase [Aspergillus udagawae]
MGSIEYREIPQLTPLERIAPKGYVRYIFLFHLGKDYNINKVSQVLQIGYETLAREIPEVACECIPDTDIQKKGVMRYRKIEEEDAARIAVKDLRDSFPLSFKQLKGKGFPVSYFDAETFCPAPIWPVPGEKVRTSLVQASFIRGGRILGWNLLHLSGDGTSWYIWTQIWADACRRAQGLEGVSLNLPIEIWGDRERARKPSGRNAGNIKYHPEWTILPFTPTSPPPKMMSPNHRGQVFYFSKDSLKSLKAEASPANATEFHGQQWVSTNDALSALLWRTLMAVQNPLETLKGDPTSVFNIAIDGRLRTNPKVHPQTLGCFMEYIAVSAPVRKILSTLKIADLAVMIRKAILNADEEWTDDTIALEEQLEDVDRLVATAFLDVPGFNCLLSSWVKFDLYGLEWGPVLGDRIEAVRTPHVGVVNGLQVVLPRLPDGGLEVLVGVEGNCLDRLLKDPLFTKFAVAR